MVTKEEILKAFDTKDGAWWAYKEGMQAGYNEAYNSLRNQAAISAMQSIVAKCNINTIISRTYKMVAETAVKQADALIEELKKK